MTQQATPGITNANAVSEEALNFMLSYIPTSTAKAAKKKSKTKEYNCTKCPLSKNYEHTPVYSRDLMVPFSTIRENTTEKIVVLLIPYPEKDTELLSYKAREMIGRWTGELLPNANKIYLFPMVLCPHVKD